MLGNDVVDLADPEARGEALHPRFDERVLDDREQAWLATRPDPERDRWVLWAAKESAYKAARRLDPGVVFSPVRFGARLQPAAYGFTGRVLHGPRCFSLDVEVGLRFVHATCRAEPWQHGTPLAAVDVAPGGGALEPGRASAQVRGLARGRLARVLGLAPETLGFTAVERVPRLVVDGRMTDHPLSFSHHGRCAAFVAALP